MNDFGSVNNLVKLNLHVDPKTLDDINVFHQKSSYLLDKRFARFGQFPISQSALKQFEFSDNEISPFFHGAIKIVPQKKVNIRREYSQLFFNEKKMLFQDAATLLSESFAADENRKRPYPSGGALYPAEVIVVLMQERMINSPDTGIYHYRTSMSLLQKLRSTHINELYETILFEPVEQMGSPCMCFIYVINLQKAIVKYNYRGYRNAILEVGSMYQQADLVSQALGMKNRLSSSFSDLEVLKFLELDRNVYTPLVMQYFGY